MKTFIFYDCGICYSRFTSESLALECEARSIQKKVLRIGVGWEHLHHKDHPDGTDGTILVVAEAIVSGHGIAYSLWGWRDHGSGDNGPDEIEKEYGKHPKPRYAGRCGDTMPASDKKSFPQTTTPRWKRAKDELHRHGINLIRWDGSEKCFESEKPGAKP